MRRSELDNVPPALNPAQLVSPIPESALCSLLKDLELRFEGYPFPEEGDPHQLIVELGDKIRDLGNLDEPLTELGPGSPTCATVLVCLRTFDAFTYRAYRFVEGQLRYWSPLDQSYAEFIAQTDPGEVLVHYRSDREHPAPDIIYKWGLFRIAELISPT
jgi:hypothetical protein